MTHFSTVPYLIPTSNPLPLIKPQAQIQPKPQKKKTKRPRPSAPKLTYYLTAALSCNPVMSKDVP